MHTRFLDATYNLERTVQFLNSMKLMEEIADKFESASLKFEVSYLDQSACRY